MQVATRQRVFVCLILWLLSLCSWQKATAQPLLKAEIESNGTEFQELGELPKLMFRLTNDGAQAVNCQIFESQVRLNGKKIPSWHPKMLRDKKALQHWKMMQVEVGKSQRFALGGGFESFDSPFRKAGDYEILWTGPNFSPAKLMLYVRPDVPRANEPLHITFVRRLRAVLPKGWDAIYVNNARSSFQIRRAKVLRMQTGGGINGSGEKSSDVYDQFQILLWISEENVTPDNYAAVKANNQAIYGQMSEMEKGMRGINHKFDYYMPKTPEEKAKIDAYNALKKSVVYLPSHHFAALSLDWGGVMQGGENDYLRVIDKKARTECKSVVDALQNLLTRYEPPRTETP